MKALHIVKTAHAATWVLHQVRVLVAARVDVSVALPSQTEGLAPQYRAAGATVYEADLNPAGRKPWAMPGVMRACRELVEQVRPDLIHTHHVGTTFLVRAALGKKSPIPRIFQVAGPLHLESDFFSWLDLRLSGPQDFWIATCNWTRNRYRALGVTEGHVFLSYAGTDTAPFGGPRTGILRRELGIPINAPLVGMVAYMYAPKWILGQHRGLKGHETFIAAMGRVRERRPEVRAIIIGGPWNGATWYEQRLRDLGAQSCNGSLYFTGSRNDVAAIYPDLDLAVVPSLSENLGGAVEPLMSGVPVVASNVGGLPDVVHDGQTGWLVPSANPGTLARAIEEALNNPQQAQLRTERGQKLARQLMDVGRTGREVVGIYENILSPPQELERTRTLRTTLRTTRE
jgi:glycosyltransferase involved in cell wall biosynthesis